MTCRLPDEQLGELAAVVCAILDRRVPQTGLVDALTAHLGPVYAELRKSGQLVRAGWASEANQWMSFCRLIQSLRGADGSELLLCFCKGTDGDRKHAIANIQRGVSAYELRNRHETLRISPFAVVAQNRSLEKMLSEFSAQHDLAAEDATLQEFETEQFHIDLHAKTTMRLFRCSRLVPLSSITRSYVEQLERLLSSYLVQSIQPDGRMVYLYYPSRGTEDQPRNNAIRQWMATRALVQVWKRCKDDVLIPVIRRNIDFNLQAMYREEGRVGLIFDGDKAKLGAVALAAMTLSEPPFAKPSIYQRLRTTVDALWTESGQFRTFYRPSGRMDCQNFYPGEALLLWSQVMPKDDSLPDRFWKSFEFYQRWHHANPNPAFVPWHTQAYFNVWKLDRDARLSEAIFEMNDWLLDVQQWESAPCPDCQGRFYDPKRPFGPPHASSTAVYMEGLADAFALARELGDDRRVTAYRTAILRGLRSIAQLTFKDDADMFYVAKRNHLRGGVRTTEYNNIVRIDNVQHSLMAIQKVLDVFDKNDFWEADTHSSPAPATAAIVPNH